MTEPGRQPDPRRTLLKALAVLAMLAVTIFGIIYTGRMIWMLPARP